MIIEIYKVAIFFYTDLMLQNFTTEKKKSNNNYMI